MSTVNCAQLGGHPGQLVDETPNEPKVRVPVTDPLGHYGSTSGANRVFRMEDGRILAEFKEDLGNIKVLYSNEEEALRGFIALRKDAANRARLNAGARALEEGNPPSFERTLSTTELDPELRIDQLIHGEAVPALAAPETYITGKARATFAEILPVRTWLKSGSPAARQFGTMLERKEQIVEQLTARYSIEVERVLSRLDDNEVRQMRQIVETRTIPGREEVFAAHRELNGLADRLYNEAKALGIAVADREQNYFPHVHNMRRFSDPEYIENIRQTLANQGTSPEQIEGILSHTSLGRSREQAIQEIMNAHRSAGNQLTVTEAQSIYERFLQQNSHFISGHLERDRISSIPPVDDGRLAYTIAFAKNANRLAEAQVFGSSYEKAYSVLDQVLYQDGARHHGLARRAFDLEIGRTQARLPEWLQSIYDWQAAKLSLSVLSNLTQVPVNVPARVGVGPSLRALGSFLGNPREAAQHAREVGSIVFHAFDQLQLHGMEAWFPPNEAQTWIGRLAQGTGKAIRDLSLVAFNLAETMNRGIATYAGEFYFDQQVAALARNPADRLAIQRLHELGFTNSRSIAHILENARTPDAGLMSDFRRLAGKRISDETQFTAGVSRRPLFFNESAPGKMLGQFKQFSLGQTEFIAQNLFAYRRGDTQRTLRTLGLITTAFPAIGAAAIGLRSLFTGETPSSKKLTEFFEQPNVGNALMAGVAAMATTGTLGIVADLSGTALLGNSFALGSFAVAPSVSTAINLISASASVLKGVTTQDLDEFETATRVLGREFGGVGSALVKGTLGEPDRRRETTGLSGLQGLRGLSGL